MSEEFFLRTKHDPKEHPLRLLEQAKAILDGSIETLKAAEEKDLDTVFQRMFLELADIFFYLGLLGSNIRLHLVAKALEGTDEENRTDKTDKTDRTNEGEAEAE